MMENLEKLVAVGKTLGFEGKELSEWIDGQQKKMAEQEKAKLKADKEIFDRNIAWEREKAETDMRLFQEKLKVSEAEKENLEASMTSTSQVPKRLVPPSPKLPPFDEKVDEFDSYLLRFERVATQQGWPEEQWAACLSTCLRGKALEVYSRLSSSDSQDYSKLKEALFYHFDLTEEGFRKRFYKTKKLGDESWSQFLARASHYLERWVELSNTEETYEGLFNLIMKNRIIDELPERVAIFVKERKPKTAEDIAGLATTFNEAHQNDFRERVSSTIVKRCFICNMTGHTARDCRNNIINKTTSFAYEFPRRNHTYQNNQKSFTRNNYSHTKGTYYPQPICSFCNLRGHYKKDCYKYKNTHTNISAGITCSEDEALFTKKGQEVKMVSAFVKNVQPPPELSDFPTSIGKVNNIPAVVIRDTGCNTVLVKKHLVSDEQLTGKFGIFRVATLEARKAPYAIVNIDCDFFSGTAEALVVENLLGDLLLGNIKGVKNVNSINSPEAIHIPTINANIEEKSNPINFKELPKEQRDDPSLKKLQDFVDKNAPGKAHFLTKNSLLYREFYNQETEETIRQLVLPEKYRQMVLKLAHESRLGSHMGISKTSDRILQEFYWPGIYGDTKRFCRSCDVCQRNCSKSTVKKAPLEMMPNIGVPFTRVSMDLVGPLNPPSSRGHKYILTLVDTATRYPEAVPLRNIDAQTIAEALVDIFSRLGIPQEILSDRGTQFTSNIMNQVCKLLGIQQKFTTPYHPACNGLVERFNGTLKNLLKKVSDEHPRKWDKYLTSILFAYREVPQSSLGFSPFEMLFGRHVRGPLAILRELMEGQPANEQLRTEYEYVIDLRQKLEETWNLARTTLEQAQKRQKNYYDRITKTRKLKVGDKVLLLLPTDNNKLLLRWKGPFEIVETTGPVDYVLDINGRRKKFHINLLKQYFERDQNSNHTKFSEISDENRYAGNIIKCTESDIEEGEGSEGKNIPLPALSQAETIEDVVIDERLSEVCRQQLRNVLGNFVELFSDIPGCTDLEMCKITMQDESVTPFRSKPYVIPHNMTEKIDKEIEMMRKLEIIEPTTSPFCSPVVLVKKSDGSTRICVDFRKLNANIEFDSEPLPSPEAIFARINSAKYLTKIDLAKGYWQVPVAPESRKYTAFTTGGHTFQFRRMPFGLVSAPAIFSRMMRKLIDGIDGIDNYLDDVIIYSNSWEEHLCTIEKFCKRLHDHNLTARPKKCLFGAQNLEFLGHIIGDHKQSMKEAVVKDILNSSEPKTKKQLKSFLGLANFYRNYIPQFATIVAPLTDLTKKRESMKDWGVIHVEAFRKIKGALSSQPVLKLPKIHEPFTIRTDASDVGLGAVLLQDHEGILHPVMYASRSLSDRERRFSAVEKEGLAIVWALKKFEIYTYGQTFTLQTDNKAISHINEAKVNNNRIFRWAMMLQEHRFTVKHISSVNCVGADYLSRA